jgi:hypothetical protein
VGENRDDDEENERARACEPQLRLCRNACRRGRHRSLTLQVAARLVKSDRATALTSAPRAFKLPGSMSRTPNAAKSIFAFVARISLR